MVLPKDVKIVYSGVCVCIYALQLSMRCNWARVAITDVLHEHWPATLGCLQPTIQQWSHESNLKNLSNTTLTRLVKTNSKWVSLSLAVRWRDSDSPLSRYSSMQELEICTDNLTRSQTVLTDTVDRESMDTKHLRPMAETSKNTKKGLTDKVSGEICTQH